MEPVPNFDDQEAFVLLLSLEHAASGSNLTAANHVIFVHPMNADTLSSAVAYERQALARVRRVGQERAEVHFWRFVTRETVEEHMHQLLDFFFNLFFSLLFPSLSYNISN